jgi:hypothetical protein
MEAGTSQRQDKRTGGAQEVVEFPSVDWFQHLADLMNANRARQEQLGYVDCTVGFTVTDGGPAGEPWGCRVTFEEFEATRVYDASTPGAPPADFALEATRATWQAMIESIADGGGRPALEQTLNYLSHPGTPVFLRADDALCRDMYFRYNQSLQEFVNASAAFRTVFR